MAWANLEEAVGENPRSGNGFAPLLRLVTADPGGANHDTRDGGPCSCRIIPGGRDHGSFFRLEEARRREVISDKAGECLVWGNHEGGHQASPAVQPLQIGNVCPKQNLDIPDS